MRDVLGPIAFFFGGFFFVILLVYLSTGVNLLTQKEPPEPQPQRMMCVTLNYEKGGFLKTMVWDSHNMVIEPSGKVTSPEGFYNPFPGELCLVAPLINSRGPKP